MVCYCITVWLWIMIGAQSHKTWLNKFLYSGNLQLSCKSPWRHKMQLYYAGLDCFFMISFHSLNRGLLPPDQFRMADGLLNYFPLFCFCLFSSKTCKQCFFFYPYFIPLYTGRGFLPVLSRCILVPVPLPKTNFNFLVPLSLTEADLQTSVSRLVSARQRVLIGSGGVPWSGPGERRGFGRLQEGQRRRLRHTLRNRSRQPLKGQSHNDLTECRSWVRSCTILETGL